MSAKIRAAGVVLAAAIRLSPVAAQDVSPPPTSQQLKEVQSTDSVATCPGLKIEIRVPDDVVRPQGSVLLEIKLTNVAQHTIWVSSTSSDFESYEFELKDAQGALVPRTAEWMRALSERSFIVNRNVAAALAAGASLVTNLVLDKMFDLRIPGQYTLRVSSSLPVCGKLDTRVTSNSVHITVDEPSNRSSMPKAGISVVANATRARLPIGWGAPLDIAVQNNTSHSLKWAVDKPPNTAPDEFLTGVEVFDAAGTRCPPPERPDHNWSFSRFRANASTIEIPPGKSAEQIILLGDLFDIGKSGRYGAKVVLLDPVSNRLIESSLVSFEIEEMTPSRPLPRQPPFLVTLKSVGEPISSDVSICMSNISDHDIRMDNSSAKDFVSVEDLNGNPASLTEAAQKARKLVDLRQEPAGRDQCCTWHTVKPREALCGGLTVGAMYDLSKTGAYRIRVDRYDEPNASPMQKLADLPIVHSNWLTIVGNAAGSSER